MKENPPEFERLTSRELAEHVIDALVVAKIVKSEDVAKALDLAEEEIEIRKALGDY
jgi:hypothetical protein